MTWKDNLPEGSRNAGRPDFFRARETTFVQVCQRIRTTVDTTVKNYMHMNDETIQEQKRKYSPGDHLPSRMPGPRQTRRRGYRTRGQGQKKHQE